ncbi:nicotinamide riboside transporter PnuC [Pseudorhodobacter ferrugineus]|uniref:nicotinamide riboside transporter PnuC n=1 Tax=Pseudorhodobacter ferrugineus TaxID=77008 RepID=UPI0003B5BF2C|nr:nicotinamide riboside transporter PnuC [Pseudorhodobacter ferrugineus]
MDSTITEFFASMFGSRAIEIIAATCGFINVALIIRRSIWNYPFGILMVILYAWIFYDYRLYSDALLQVFFLVIQVFGLFWWLSGRNAQGQVIVRSMPPAQFGMVLAAGTVGAGILGLLMHRYTDASLPFADASVAALSVVAQTLLARRFLQNWYVWIAVDVLAIGVFATKSLVPTATLYALFLVLAVTGLLTWQRAWRNGTAVA